MSGLNIAVLGGGHGGHTFSALLTLAGHRVRMYDRYPEAIAGAAGRNNTIRYHGVAGQGEVRVDLVTTDVAAATESADLLLVVLPAFAHAFMAEALAPYLRPGQAVILNTGSSGSALEFRAVLNRLGKGQGVAIAETETLVYTCRLTGPGEVGIYRIKPWVMLAALPAADLPRVTEAIGPLYPQFDPVPNVLWTTLANGNPIAHLPNTLLNVAMIERGHGEVRFWRQGVTPSIGRMMEILDAERLAVAEAYGAKLLSEFDWLTKVYGAEGRNVKEKIDSNPAYDDVRAPTDLRHRFVTEDVPMGLVPMVELGRLVGVATPAMDMMITLAGLLNGEDYRATGRTLERMGLGGADKAGVLRYVGAAEAAG